MASRYATARNFEYKVRDDMAKRGYIAIRSPASKTPVDVYCIGLERKVFIQCKTNGVIGPAEWNRFYDYCESVNAIPILAMRGARGRGITYKLIIGKKKPHKRQPYIDWIPLEGERRYND